MPGPNSSDSVGSTKKTCPLTPATLVVVTLRGDTGDFVAADVSIKGKTPGSGKTVVAENGSKTFKDLKGGEYTIEAKDPVVQRGPSGAAATVSFDPVKAIKVQIPPGGDVMAVFEFVRQAQLKVKVYFFDAVGATAKEELIGDVKVTLKHDGLLGKTVEKTTAKGTGLVDFGALPAGLYHLSVALNAEQAKLYPKPGDRTVRLARSEDLTVPLRLEKRGGKRLRLRLVRGERRRTGACRAELEASPGAAPIAKVEKAMLAEGDLDLVLPAHLASAAKIARVYFLGQDGKDDGEALALAVGLQNGEMKKASATSQMLRALGFLEREPFPEKLEKPEQKLELNLALARYQRTRASDVGEDRGLAPFTPDAPAPLQNLREDYWDYDYAATTLPPLTFKDAAIPGPPRGPREQQNDVLLNCDLCVLAYHLYHQTLVWPLDPWYEVLARGKTDRRTHFMDKIHERAADKLEARNAGSLYAGPASFRHPVGGSANLQLDPVVTNLGQVRPRSSAFTGDGSVFIGIQTPRYIVDAIRKVSVASYVRPFEQAWPHGATRITEVVDYGDGHDELVGFEGGTGSFQESDAAWSLMGYVLKRTRADRSWDAHIVFRGSRSGNATRAVLHAGDNIFGAANGNADWVTDLAGKQVADPYIGGQVATGFAAAFKRCAGTLQLALQHLHAAHGAPQSIHVAGHSLGAALASLCCGALTAGTPGAELRKVLPGWPLGTLRGYFFALPPIGTKAYCTEYNKLMGGRAVAPYVKGDMVVECSKSVGVRQTGKMGFVGWAAGEGSYSPGLLDRMPRPAGFHDDENSHELYLIRAALIHKQQENRVRVPAAIKNVTPWATYANFADVLAGKALSTVLPGAAQPKIIGPENLREVLRNYRFARHFEHFLQLLEVAVADPKSYRGYHGDNQYRLAAERVALALSMCGEITSEDPRVVADTVATQVAALIAYSRKAAWRRALDYLEATVVTSSEEDPTAVGIALKADELLGESFNTRIGLGLILRAFEEKAGTTIDDFAAMPELNLCLRVSLPDIAKWQKKKAKK